MQMLKHALKVALGVLLIQELNVVLDTIVRERVLQEDVPIMELVYFNIKYYS